MVVILTKSILSLTRVTVLLSKIRIEPCTRKITTGWKVSIHPFDFASYTTKPFPGCEYISIGLHRKLRDASLAIFYCIILYVYV